jgi:hypothetical protein
VACCILLIVLSVDVEFSLVFGFEFALAHEVNI